MVLIKSRAVSLPPQWNGLLDGLKCLDMLRASKGTEQTPVILMSAAPPQGVQSRTDLALLEKPFEMDILLALIRRLLFES